MVLKEVLSDWWLTGHIVIFLCLLTGCITSCITFSVLLLQTDSAGGNCLFVAIKASMNIHHSNSKDVPYYPTRYFRQQVVAWMVKHHQLVVANKGVALKPTTGCRGRMTSWRGHFPSSSISGMCSSITSGGMKSSSMLLILCRVYGSWFWTSGHWKSTRYSTVFLWQTQMWASCTTVGPTILWPVSIGCVTGHIVIFDLIKTGHFIGCQGWWSDWSLCYIILM